MDENCSLDNSYNAIVYFLPSINYLTEMNTTARGVEDNENDKDKKNCKKYPKKNSISFCFPFRCVSERKKKNLFDFD